jgi:hypothetical protein
VDQDVSGRRIRCRATLHLSGGPGQPNLRPGDVVMIDPTIPYMAQLIDAQALVPVDPPRPVRKRKP